MKRIRLTKNKFTIVDDADFDWLSQWNWYALPNKKTFYAVRHTRVKEGRKESLLYMHREIAVRMGVPQVDHKDRDGLNNRRKNLRPATAHQNMGNRGMCSHNTSGFIGVSKRSDYNAYRAYLGKTHLGNFRTARDAAVARDAAAKKEFGQFAVLNFT